MSRTAIPKALRNSVWISNVGSKFETQCFVGCGSIINAFTFDVGHIQAVANGGTNEPENLKPICGTCNKSSGTMNMIEFIKKSGFTPDWLKKSTILKQINTGPVVLFNVEDQIPNNYQIPRFEKIGNSFMITGWYYLVDLPIEIDEIPKYISVPEATLINGLPINDFKISNVNKVPLDLRILQIMVKDHRKIMKYLKQLQFNVPGSEFYKLIDSMDLVFEDYTNHSELIIYNVPLYDSEKIKWIERNNVEDFDEYIKKFMESNKINCRY